MSKLMDRKYEYLSDIYSIFVATEHLERAYIRDAISLQDYTPLCLKLIAQFKTSTSLEKVDINEFTSEYELNCPAAYKRLVVMGIPATVEHATTDSTGKAKNIAETVQFFITLMDSLKLNYVAVDQIHPQLSDLVTSLNKQFQSNSKLKEWLITLNRLKASDELDDDQVRQLLFDLESSYAEFQNNL